MAAAAAFASPDARAEFHLAGCKATFMVTNFEAAMVAHEKKCRAAPAHGPEFREISSGPIMSAGRYGFEIVVFWGIDGSGRPDEALKLGWAVRRTDAIEGSCIMSTTTELVNTTKRQSMSRSDQGFIRMEKGAARGLAPWNGKGISLSDVLDVAQGWLHNGDLVIQASAEVVIDRTGGKNRAPQPEDVVDHQELSAQFKELFSNKTFADCTIIAGDIRIEAHRCILAARSPVFSAMLSGGMMEAKDRMINIDDICPSAVQHMVSYLYTGALDVALLDGDESCLQLLRAAHRYEVSGLVHKCADLIEKRLAVETVCERLKFADLLGCGKLKAQCLDFIAHHIAEVQRSQGYEEMANPRLLMDIIARMQPPAKRQRTAFAAE